MHILVNGKATQTADNVIEANAYRLGLSRTRRSSAFSPSPHGKKYGGNTMLFSPFIGPCFRARRIQKESEFQRTNYSTGRCIQRPRGPAFTVSIACSTGVEGNPRRLLACDDSHHSVSIHPSRNGWNEYMSLRVPKPSTLYREVGQLVIDCRRLHGRGIVRISPDRCVALSVLDVEDAPSCMGGQRNKNMTTSQRLLSRLRRNRSFPEPPRGR